MRIFFPLPPKPARLAEFIFSRHPAHLHLLDSPAELGTHSPLPSFFFRVVPEQTAKMSSKEDIKILGMPVSPSRCDTAFGKSLAPPIAHRLRPSQGTPRRLDRSHQLARPPPVDGCCDKERSGCCAGHGRSAVSGGGAGIFQTAFNNNMRGTPLTNSFTVLRGRLPEYVNPARCLIVSALRIRIASTLQADCAAVGPDLTHLLTSDSGWCLRRRLEDRRCPH